MNSTKVLKIKISLILLLLMFGCVTIPIEENSIVSKVDKFTNQTILTTNEHCSPLSKNVSWDYCTQFKIIKDDVSFFYIGKKTYHSKFEMNYLKSIWLKVEGSNKTIKIDGPFDVLVEGNYYKEIQSVEVNKELYTFLKSSIGKKVLIRFYTKKHYSDYEYVVSSDDKGLTKMFINNFEPNIL